MDNFENHKINFVQLKNYVFPSSEEPFILTIEKDNVKFEFLIRVKKGCKKVIVLGSGAYDATSNLKPPIFQRHKWIKHFDETLIYYNDPTLYLGQINIGWGFGNRERHYLKEIAEIIELLLNKIGINKKHTLFYGSSAGGFMSLMLAGFIRESKVLVNNPQTIVWNYYERHVGAMFKHTIPELSSEKIIEEYRERLSVIDFYKMIRYVPPIKYLQNVASKRDLTHQLNPFIEGLEQIDDNCFSGEISLRLYSDKELGHNPLRIQDSLRFIKLAVEDLG